MSKNVSQFILLDVLQAQTSLIFRPSQKQTHLLLVSQGKYMLILLSNSFLRQTCILSQRPTVGPSIHQIRLMLHKDYGFTKFVR